MSNNISVKKEFLHTGGRKKISYSQFSDWVKCPYSWKLGYVDKMKMYQPSVHTAFGTAIHEPVQIFVEKLYNEGSAAADEVDMVGIFLTVFERELANIKNRSVKDSDGEYILDESGEKTYETTENPVEITDADKMEFIQQGTEILESIKSYNNRKALFPSGKYECVGVEIPVNMEVMNNLSFIGYIDLVLRDTISGKYKVIDIKTSTRMWNKYQQNDILKAYQLLLYKAFYSKQYGVPLNKIDVEFLILKRTLLEGVSFPEKRTQKVVPPSSTNFVNEAVSKLVEFIESCFTEEGEYNKDGKFPKTPHKGKTKYSNCKYCDFSEKNGGPCDRKED
jgi:hypothetical protein